MSKQQGKWHKDLVYCPYGHLRAICERKRMQRGVQRSLCSINTKRVRLTREEILRAQRQHEDNKNPRKTPVIIVQEGDWVGPKGPSSQALIQLVCSHLTRLQRVHFHPLEELWCERCEKYKHIHEVSGQYSKDKSSIFFPLEDAGEAPPSFGTLSQGAPASSGSVIHGRAPLPFSSLKGTKIA